VKLMDSGINRAGVAALRGNPYVPDWFDPDDWLLVPTAGCGSTSYRLSTT
jgi:hypothetical protein